MFKLKKTYKRYDMAWWRKGYWYYLTKHRSYFRSPKTTQRLRVEVTLRFAHRDEELRDFKLRYEPKSKIPTAWDDLAVDHTKSWKRVSRCNKQWMVNFKH